MIARSLLKQLLGTMGEFMTADERSAVFQAEADRAKAAAALER